jgi:glycosyltransferase involved in cell wall biosynthesis
MNIVIVGTAYPLRGGIAHYNALLYKHLSKNHHVEIVTFSRQYPKILFPGKTQDEQGGIENALPTEPLIDSINPLTWYTAARAIARKKPDLLIFKYWLPFRSVLWNNLAPRATMDRGEDPVHLRQRHSPRKAFRRHSVHAVCIPPCRRIHSSVCSRRERSEYILAREPLRSRSPSRV